MLPDIISPRSVSTTRLRSPLLPEFGSLFDELLTRTGNGWETWRPAADLYETDDAFVLEMELSGFERDDVEITVDRGVLTVSGRRTLEEKEQDVTFYLRERSDQQLSRSFALPRSVDHDSVEAELENGLLRVTLPKTAEAKPRRIEVRTR